MILDNCFDLPLHAVIGCETFIYAQVSSAAISEALCIQASTALQHDVSQIPQCMQLLLALPEEGSLLTSLLHTHVFANRSEAFKLM